MPIGVISDQAVRTNLIVASTPILHLFKGIYKRQEPVSVQISLPKLAVESFDDCVVGRLLGLLKSNVTLFTS